MDIVADLAAFNCVTDVRRQLNNVVVVVVASFAIELRRQLGNVLDLVSSVERHAAAASVAAAGVAVAGVAVSGVAAVKFAPAIKFDIVFDLVSLLPGVRSPATTFVSDLLRRVENGLHAPRDRVLESRIMRAMMTSMIASIWFRP